MNGEGNGNPLLYSCLEKPTDRGAWRAVVHTGSQRVEWDRSDLVRTIQWDPKKFSLCFNKYRYFANLSSAHTQFPCSYHLNTFTIISTTLLDREGCRILVSQPGIEIMTPVSEGNS